MNFKGFLARCIKILPYLYINLLRLFGLVELYQPTYNPRNLYFFRPKAQRRDCDDRIAAIRKSIDFNRVESYIDIGSGLGYFVFKLSELNKIKWSLGIEKDHTVCNYANSLVILNNVHNVSFMNAELTPSTVTNLPSCGLISFLNVFHHLVYFQGFAAADSIMRQLYFKCNAYFIFETGQFNEKGYYWSESLSFMGNNPERWIQDYLNNIGYKDVMLVERFSTHLGEQKRAFFICSK